jgi:alpha-L-arabinofuranosidase
VKTVRAQVLTGPLHARNSFEAPSRIIPAKVDPAIVQGQILLSLPPRSLAVFDVRYT